MAHSRNSTLDMLKLLASYMVVFIHILFYGEIGTIFDALARFAVPFFFVVSGFYSKDITQKQLKKRILHIARLLLFAVMTYILWNVLQYLASGDMQGLAQYLGEFLNTEKLWRLFALNVPVYTEHLWYLFAILYVYIFYYVVTALKIPRKFVVSAAMLLLLLHLVLAEGLSICRIDVPVPFVRNFALMGIPFFEMGLQANTYREKLCRISDRIIAVCVVTGIVATILSRYLFGKNELYIGSLFILFSLVTVFVKYPNAADASVLASMGRYSTYIYIFHPIVSAVVKRAYSVVSLYYDTSVFLQLVHPVFVCVLSTLLAYMIDRTLGLLNTVGKK